MRALCEADSPDDGSPGCFASLHPLRRLCGYPCPLRMGNCLCKQIVSHPKPKTQHANFTACPKDRLYFYLQIKEKSTMPTTEKLKQEIADAEKKLAQERSRLQRLENRKSYYEKGDRKKLVAPPYYQRGCRGEHCTAGKGFERNGVLCFYGKDFCFVGSQGFVDGSGQCTQ